MLALTELYPQPEPTEHVAAMLLCLASSDEELAILGWALDGEPLPDFFANQPDPQALRTAFGKHFARVRKGVPG